MTEARALQISNNVSEEFADFGKTNFATKKELCEVIQYFQLQSSAWCELHQALLNKVTLFALEAMTTKQHP